MTLFSREELIFPAVTALSGVIASLLFLPTSAQESLSFAAQV
jgi:hypothetical protein